MDSNFLINGLQKHQQAQKDAEELQSANEQASEAQEKAFTESQFGRVTEAITLASTLMVQFLKLYKPNIEFPNEISTPDVDKVVQAVDKLGVTLAPQADDDTQLISAINALIPELKKIQGLKLNPQIAVAAPNVQVAAPDLSSIAKSNKDVVTAIKGIVIPEAPKVDNTKVLAMLNTVNETLRHLKFPVATTPTDPLIQYTPTDIDDAGAVQYFGYIKTDGSWYIRKFDTASSPKTLRFAFGSTAYDFTTRASLSYKLWSQ